LRKKLGEAGSMIKTVRNVGYIILEEHMETCVAEGIKNGDDEVITEAVELIKKLK
jgi:DNA-binding FrmR family transcriptional regulator